MTIRTLLIDDEEAARSRLRKLLTPLATVEIVDEGRDGIEAVALIAAHRPDLVFLDVQMPGLDGFEVLRSLPQATQWPLVIFATAYDQYALAAFEANAVAYLLKPIDREKLQVAIARIERLLNDQQDAASTREQMHALTASTRRDLQQVVARSRDRYLLLSLDDVFFFRMEDGFVKVKTSAGVYRTDYSMVDLEERLPGSFLRVHRSVIVNRFKITEVEPLFKGSYMLILGDRDRTEIQVSERQSKFVRELLELRGGT